MFVELDKKYIDMSKLAEYVASELENQGKHCKIKSKGGIPIITVDNIDYGIQVRNNSGASLVGEQKAILVKI